MYAELEAGRAPGDHHLAPDDVMAKVRDSTKSLYQQMGRVQALNRGSFAFQADGDTPGAVPRRRRRSRAKTPGAGQAPAGGGAGKAGRTPG